MKTRGGARTAALALCAWLIGTTPTELRAQPVPGCPELIQALGSATRQHKAGERQRAASSAVNTLWPGSRQSCEAKARESRKREPVVSLLDAIQAKGCLSPAQAGSYRHMLVVQEEERERGWCP
ncbi:MAG TPA: hypothetical protein VF744_15045 [Beijerinckiaceae bacterium]|jgi:hypothetical protein